MLRQLDLTQHSWGHVPTSSPWFILSSLSKSFSGLHPVIILLDWVAARHQGAGGHVTDYHWNFLCRADKCYSAI